MVKCFNVEPPRIPLFDICLCACCRRNLTRWKHSRGAGADTGKYFCKANSKGEPYINKTAFARRNRRDALAKCKNNAPVLLTLFYLPEDLPLDIVAFLRISDILNLRLTCKFMNNLCSSNYLWKTLLWLDFPDKIHLLTDNPLIATCSQLYKLSYTMTLSWKKEQQSHRSQISFLVEQFWEDESKLLAENESMRQACNSLNKLLSLQADPDPRTPVTELQDEVSCFVYMNTLVE